MKSNKGQALLEFVLILPIFLMLLLSVIDFGRILYEKNRLENIMSDVVEMHYNGISDNNIQNNINSYYKNKYHLVIDYKNNNITYELSQSLKIYTPGLDIILTDPYKVEVSRVINNEA